MLSCLTRLPCCVLRAVVWCDQVNKGEYVRMFLEHIYAPIIMNPIAKVRPSDGCDLYHTHDDSPTRPLRVVYCVCGLVRVYPTPPWPSCVVLHRSW